MNIKIRDFDSDDAEAVHAVAMKAWRATYRDIYASDLHRTVREHELCTAAVAQFGKTRRGKRNLFCGSRE
jgi:hypothetical protein